MQIQGQVVYGNRNWFSVGGMSVQPSEAGKLALAPGELAGHFPMLVVAVDAFHRQHLGFLVS